MRLLFGYQNTKINGEDIALTPYLFGVYNNGLIKIYGIGICWVHLAVYVGLGFNIPKKYHTLRNLNTTFNTEEK